MRDWIRPVVGAACMAITLGIILVGWRPQPSSGQVRPAWTPCGCFCGFEPPYPPVPPDMYRIFNPQPCTGILAADACARDLGGLPKPELKSVCEKVRATKNFRSYKDSCPVFEKFCGPSENDRSSDATCDKKKACEAIEAMEKTIAKYDGTLYGQLSGSLGEMMLELNRQMQKLSEALACRFNEGHNAADAKIMNDFIGQLTRDKNELSAWGSQGKLPNKISCESELGDPTSSECRAYETLQRIRENLSRFGGLLGCKGPPQSNSRPKADCKELSNSVLDGLTTFFDELDKLKVKKQIGSGDSYDQVADGIEGALKELEDAAKEIEGTGGTAAQQYKDLQGKIANLKKLLDAWGQMKAASCLPKDVEQLLRRLAEEKRAGTEHKATCTELCAASADWYVKISGLSAQRGTFFKACTLACF